MISIPDTNPTAVTQKPPGDLDLKSLPKVFGARLDYIMRFRGVTIDQLACTLGCSREMLASWVSGLKQPRALRSVALVSQIEKQLQVPAETLRATDLLGHFARGTLADTAKRLIGSTIFGRHQSMSAALARQNPGRSSKPRRNWSIPASDLLESLVAHKDKKKVRNISPSPRPWKNRKDGRPGSTVRQKQGKLQHLFALAERPDAT